MMQFAVLIFLFAASVISAQQALSVEAFKVLFLTYSPPIAANRSSDSANRSPYFTNRPSDSTNRPSYSVNRPINFQPVFFLLNLHHVMGQK